MATRKFSDLTKKMSAKDRTEIKARSTKLIAELPLETLGSFMRRRRDELDLSLRGFAQQLNCSAAFVSDIELGRRNPSEKVLAEIARILLVKVEKLQEMDVRAPIEEIKRLTQSDPRFALALRTMIDKKVSAEELLDLANGKRATKQPLSK
jgi:transcriptional regulator with XRE-family HTH domain